MVEWGKAGWVGPFAIISCKWKPRGLIKGKAFGDEKEKKIEGEIWGLMAKYSREKREEVMSTLVLIFSNFGAFIKIRFERKINFP